MKRRKSVDEIKLQLISKGVNPATAQIVAEREGEKAAPKMPKGPTGIERRYAQYLVDRKATGSIRDFVAQGIKFRIGAVSNKTGRDAWYKPDFVVDAYDRNVCIETKGHEREDDRIKLKTCAMLYPMFRWVMVKEVNGRFIEEVFG
jgi:hypothetical protein